MPTRLRPDLPAIEAELKKPDLDPDYRRSLEDWLSNHLAILEANPLEKFEPHSRPQALFMAARTPIQAAFAGNRFGKTAALVTKCLIQHCPKDLLPSHLLPYRLTPFGEPIMGRLLVPSEKAFEEYTKPTFKQWCPKQMLLGGSWDSAWDKKFNILRFSDGGQIGIYTYRQDPETMVGSALWYVAYDEPPPESIRNESLIRLADHDGFEMFAMTPVNMTGGGIGWIWRKIWKRREHPDVTVVKASIYDNPLLNRQTIERILAEYPEEERQAREKGDFVHFGGMVYEGGFEEILVDPPATIPEDVVVGIDPGLRHSALVWVGFDNDNVGLVFDEVRLFNKTYADVARAITDTNAKWAIRHQPFYVIDPYGQVGNQSDLATIKGGLARFGIHAVNAPNPSENMRFVEAGVQQVRWRKRHGRLFVSRECRTLRSEAEEYRIEDRPDEEFKVVKENDHGLDSLRYACSTRPFYPAEESRPPDRLGFEIKDGGIVVGPHIPELPQDTAPLGALS